MSMKRVTPQKYHDASDDDDDLRFAPPSSEGDGDDDMATLSFGALNTARKQLAPPRRRGGASANDSSHDDDSDSDSDAPPEESTSASSSASSSASASASRKRHKHAPARSSTKKKVSVVRPIHGLDINPKYNPSKLYQDIRFDAAYGKADAAQARANYAFLDEYRESEIAEVKRLLKQPPGALADYDRRQLEYQAKSLQSRLDSLRAKDRDRQVLREFKSRVSKQGEGSKPFYLKNSDKRKLLQKARFEQMTPKQREKAVERKRKRRLGQEMRALEGDGFK
ncbi:hypothetical protein DIURU_004085 [Diutina rugosa]|uniref:rRNA biogenesis protein RRP36 n=1 Tax=Diutina rugosa TaxID=5481 RepID=A0A642UKT1_DIURU|nr:uncharacterized protein DIURU_004085 [Diutina rugosa]KAA8899828.1 hypothetical protein DIURU_004085 [Diutina rugosa]